MTYLALSEILANVPYYVPLILLLMPRIEKKKLNDQTPGCEHVKFSLGLL